MWFVPGTKTTGGVITGKKAALRLTFCLLAIFLLFLPACQRNSTKDILRQEASSYRFSLAGWHLKNLPAKLVSVVYNLRAMSPPEKRKALLGDFFELQAELQRLEMEVARGTALHGSSSEMETLESRRQEIRLKYRSLAPRIEAIIEYEITQALAGEGIGFRLAGWNFTIPPLLFVFQQVPNLLVVSPRHRIEWLADQLLSPYMTISELEMVESQLSRYDNLSAIIVSLGGLASYPAVVGEDSSFYRSIFLATHEWTHQYLFFYPLGRAYFGGGAVREINETIADMVGYEVADRIFRHYGYEPPPRQLPPMETGFDFTIEMRHTRLVTDRLLEEGKIDEAEQYMAERRQLLTQEGYYIRKLNQAYFAFHGAYAFDPASVSPVGEQLEELRGYYGSLGEFVLVVRELRTHEQLLALLTEKRAGQFDFITDVSRLMKATGEPPTREHREDPR